jgi:hypothetical protein
MNRKKYLAVGCLMLATAITQSAAAQEKALPTEKTTLD